MGHYSFSSKRKTNFPNRRTQSAPFLAEPLESRVFLAANVTVNFGNVHQTLRAMGGDAARVVWANDNNATDPVGDWATTQLHPQMMRVAIPWPQWQPAATGGYQDSGRVHNEFVYMQQLQAKGIPLIATAWQAPGWMVQTVTTPLGNTAGNILPAMYNAAADSLTQYLLTAKNTYGVTIPYLSFNEANGGFFIYMPADQMAKFIEVAGPKFVAAGLGTKFLVGDTWSSATLVDYATPILSDVAAQPYLGPISFHSWWTENSPDSVFTAIAQLGQQYNKEIWSPEVGYDAVLGGNNPAAFATWDNAIRLAEIYSRVLKFSGATTALYWAYQTVHNGGAGDENDYPLATQSLQPYPAYYIVKQLADNLVGGSQITDVSADDPGLMTLAAKNPATGNSMVQVINTSTHSITAAIHGLAGSTYAVARSSGTENAVAIGTAYGSAGDFTLTLPAQSLVTLSTLGVTQPFGALPANVAGSGATIIQAEAFDSGGSGVAYQDAEPINLGGAYRPADGVDLESTGDSGGGYDVGWTHGGESLNYTINVSAAGKYDLAARVASAGAGGVFHVELDGVDITGAMSIPDTGAWQSYQTITRGGITLPAGSHLLRLAFDTNGPTGFTGNVNYLQLSPTLALPGPTPFSGVPISLPGTIECENFDNGGEGIAYHDTTAANEGSAYRQTGVDIESTGDAGGGYDVGWTHAGEWLGYTATIAAAGPYNLTIRAANNSAGAAFHVEVDGVNVTGSLVVPNTGAFQTYADVIKSNITLTAGQHFVRLVMDGNSANGFAGNFNRLTFAPAGTPPPPPVGSPFGGTPWAAPGTIEAENFDLGGEAVAYHDTDPANAGGQYRAADAVDIESASDAGGGYDVGWTHAGEWLAYTINIAAAGKYDLAARVASAGAGGTFHIEFAGVDKTGPLIIPNTGGWQTYTTLSAPGLSLAAGTYVIRVLIDANGAAGFAGNFNWFRFTPSPAIAAPGILAASR